MNFVQNAFISPWINELTGLKTRNTSFGMCEDCGTGAFSVRYSHEEMGLLYSDYRGFRYQKVRQSWEPSYSSDLNLHLGGDSGVLFSRHLAVLDSLEKAGRSSSAFFETAVDVGGDRGQFIPPIFSKRYVVDISGVDLCSGVHRLSSLHDMKQVKPNLVMACGILEHLASPLDFLHELKRSLGVAQNRLIYIEVPSGVPIRRGLLNRSTSWLLGPILIRSRSLWTWLDRRAGTRRTSSIMPMRQSEHLNFFTMQGLQILLSRIGYRVLLIDEIELPLLLSASGRIQFNKSIRLLAEVA